MLLEWRGRWLQVTLGSDETRKKMEVKRKERRNSERDRLRSLGARCQISLFNVEHE
jgi:hypothetical protein